MGPKQKIWVADDTTQMTQVLDLLNWSYHGSAPSQTPCPIHKGGTERKASARVYTDTCLYCYTCGRQYRPTEVYAAVRRVSREDAAVTLLEKFKPDAKAVEESLSGWSRPRIEKPVPVAILAYAEENLRRFRHKAPLDVYREWCRRLDDFGSYLREISDVEQQRARLYAFRDEMIRALSKPDEPEVPELVET